MEDAAEEEASGEEEPTEETDATDASAGGRACSAEEPADENEPNGYEYDEPEAAERTSDLSREEGWHEKPNRHSARQDR